MKKIAVSFAILAVSNICAAQEAVEFHHDMPDSARPWAHENFDAAEDKFTFAVFSDLNGGERRRVFDIAVEQLNLLRPELIMNVGDLISGGTDDRAELRAQWEIFDERASKAKAPVFFVGENHDLGLDAVRGAELQRVWADRYGRPYYSFVYKDVLFLVLNTQEGEPSSERLQELERLALEARNRPEGAEIQDTELFYTPEFRAGSISDEQSAYFLKVIAENPNVRWTFLFMHRAPWERDDEENFSAIEAALSDHPYTVFHGHEHSYQHVERHDRDYIRLATTGGGQPPSYRKSTLTDRIEGRAVDQVTLVTVDGSEVDIATLLLSGILDKTGHVPLDGDDVCFELAVCGNEN